MTCKKLLDEGTWPGKGFKLVWRGVQVGIVLLFFFGVFLVIGVNWVVDRVSGNSAKNRAGTGSGCAECLDAKNKNPPSWRAFARLPDLSPVAGRASVHSECSPRLRNRSVLS